ncbi:ribosome maturation factor RimM [Saprospira sp. CCB-QB6]|uniref:ribosome maturation factor RimM n=1 Tax=Saprospira sp. CCB-QB6 TaxID=3023936 RepID=UPI00234A134A|nr:ribosome maturation factor RimM [Saprospira sp. CCB-QB6]WCL81669.1 ribosome maturation factor RimM [Saprospira sp. CCB-QB6]
MSAGFVELGKTLKPHHIKGAIKAQLEEGYVPSLEAAAAVFIEHQGQKIPFFLEELEAGKTWIIKLEGIDDRNQAEQWSRKTLYLREKDLLEGAAPISGLAFDFLIGFHLIDEDLGDLGEIIDLLELPQQEMAILNIEEKEVLIPLHEDLIVEILEAEKQIIMQLPEGLLDL